jgi:sterol desaturase/sphingolipid hydroxylase (fatty acid hydroxylase superfamily)
MDISSSHPGLMRGVFGIAVLVALLTWETWKPFFPFFEKNARARGGHLMRNLTMGLLNVVLTATCFAFLWGAAAAWSEGSGFGLLHRTNLPLWLHALVAVVLLDFWTYWWHRANHRVPWLWRFHRMHHSDPWMDVTSARRFHPGEIVISSVLRVPLLVLLGIYLRELVLYELIMAVIVDFHHANIGLREPVDRLLRAVIVTPAMHKVHHSQARVETDSNFTSLLSVWDRVFGSFRLRPDLSAIRIGLEGWSDTPHQTLPGMLATPIRRNAKSGASYVALARRA